MPRHVVMPPPLESSAWVVGVIAVDFDELVEHSTSEIEVLVAQMLA